MTVRYILDANTDRGFTLVEIAIVLVVIGLVVGGILVARDLIRSAELRATLSQIEKYNAAVKTFSLKYQGIPGDLRDLATAFGFQARSGADGHGDGDERIEPCAPAQTTVARYAGCENVLFWRDLSDANLVDGSFTTATDTDAVINTGQQTLYYPLAKAGRSAVVAVFSQIPPAPDGNYFGIASNITTDATGRFTNIGQTFTPNEAYAMDAKIDDGFPQTGRVFGDIFSTAWDGRQMGAAYCSVTGATYNTGGTYGDTAVCMLEIKVE